MKYLKLNVSDKLNLSKYWQDNVYDPISLQIPLQKKRSIVSNMAMLPIVT
jgi:hypothetical protein